MRAIALARRNFMEVWRDPLSLGITIGLPILMLLVLQAFGGVDAFFTPTMLTPGIVLFGFVMLMFSTAMTLSRDRETALFSRLLTAPLKPKEFVAGYSLPYLPVAIILAAALFVIGAFLGLEISGNAGLVVMVLLVMAVFYIALGMILGSLLPLAPLSGAYAVILLLTIFGGAWMDLAAIGGVFQTMGNVLPFAHALDAIRDVMAEGAGLGDIAPDLYWVIGYTALVAVLAVFAFKRRMLE
ncbi:MAG: ABC transporter permease [Acidimicrobiia bacterium]|nr:ABC transporter permease [Acidimicrobiia bacterium]